MSILMLNIKKKHSTSSIIWVLTVKTCFKCKNRIEMHPKKTHYKTKWFFFLSFSFFYWGVHLLWRRGGKKANKSCILMRAQALTWTFLSRTPCAARWNVTRCQGGDHMTHKRMTSAWSSVGDDPEVLQMHRAPIHHICRDALMTWTTIWPRYDLATWCRWPALSDARLNFILIKTQQHANTPVVAYSS